MSEPSKIIKNFSITHNDCSRYHERRCIEARFIGDFVCHKKLLRTSKNASQEKWEDTCIVYKKFEQHDLCKKINNKTCLRPKQYRTIEGHKIYRDCWLWQYHYRCGDNAENTCKRLREKACEQIGSYCSKELEHICVRYRQLFRCPVKECHYTLAKRSEPEKLKWMDGDRFKNPTKPNSKAQFQENVARFSAVRQAGTEYNGNFIFGGNAYQCRIHPLSYSNCCVVKGWGQDLHLIHCSQHERLLAKQRRVKLCVYVGKYCAHRKKIFKICTQYKESYCCFHSKLARLVQVGGRRQLGLNFGSVKLPSCRGFTAKQLQNIDFNKINFSEYYQDIQRKLKVPKPKREINKLDKHINQLRRQEYPE